MARIGFCILMKHKCSINIDHNGFHLFSPAIDKSNISCIEKRICDLNIYEIPLCHFYKAKDLFLLSGFPLSCFVLSIFICPILTISATKDNQSPWR